MSPPNNTNNTSVSNGQEGANGAVRMEWNAYFSMLLVVISLLIHMRFL